MQTRMRGNRHTVSATHAQAVTIFQIGQKGNRKRREEREGERKEGGNRCREEGRSTVELFGRPVVRPPLISFLLVFVCSFVGLFLFLIPSLSVRVYRTESIDRRPSG